MSASWATQATKRFLFFGNVDGWRASTPMHILYAYTVIGSPGMHAIYKQLYRPQPAVRLPRWMKLLWRWL